MNKKTSERAAKSLDDLYVRPGFLLRRAHQISVSIFLAEAADVDVTTTQYGVLVILQRRNSLDQIGLSKLVGLDRSTTALVVGKLEAAGYVVRDDDPADRRRKVLVLTEAGSALLRSLRGPAERARLKALSAFSPQEAEVFVALLEKFVQTFNHIARAPINDESKAPAKKNGRKKTGSV